jgi:hypothetical protein
LKQVPLSVSTLDPYPVPAVEASAGRKEGERGVGRLVRVEAGEADPARIVDRGEQVAPASAAAAPGAIAGDAAARNTDPSQLLDVDVQKLARPLALVANDLLPREPGLSREQPCRRRIACTVDAARPSAQPSECGPRRSAARARSTACSTAAGVRLGERRGREERSSSGSPRRARPTHFEAVCREQPTTSAAAVIVAPAKTSETRRSRWRRLRTALA